MTLPDVLDPKKLEDYNQIKNEIIQPQAVPEAPSPSPLRQVHVTDYWNDPRRVARYYDALQTLPPGSQLPPWVDAGKITKAYNYLSRQNQGKAWWQWQPLAEDDPIRQELRFMTPPPMDAMTPDEQGKEWGGVAPAPNGSYAVPYDQAAQYYPPEFISSLQSDAAGNVIVPAEYIGADFSAPSTYTPSETATDDLVYGIPRESWDKLPDWQKAVIPLMPWASRGMGAAQGAIIGTSLAPGVGTVVGAGVGAGVTYAAESSYDLWLGDKKITAEEYAALTPEDQARVKQKPGGLANALNLLDMPAEAVERIVGFLAQGIDALATGDSFNVPAAWQAAKLTYDVSFADQMFYQDGKRVSRKEYINMTPEERAKLKRGIQGWNGVWFTPQGEAASSYALKLARDRIAAGEDLDTVWQDVGGMFGLSGQLRDMVGHMALDPLNLVGGLAAKGIGLGADLMKNATLAQAMQGKKDLLPGLQEYGAAIRGMKPEQASQFSWLSRQWAGITDQGTLKAYMRGVDKRAGLAGMWDNLAGLDPKSRANEALNNASQGIRLLLNEATDPTDMTKTALSLTRIGLEDAVKADLPSFLQAADMQPVALGLRSVAKPIEDLAAKYEHSRQQHDLVQNVARVMGVEPEKLLSDLHKATPDRAEDIYRQFINGLQKRAAGDPARNIQPDAQAAALLQTFAEGGSAGLDGKTLKLMAEGFTRENNPLPWNETMYKTQLIALMEDGISQWAVDWFGVKPEAWFLRLSNVVKRAQSLLLLGYNPSYMMNNAINNIVTLAWDGALSLNTRKSRMRFFEELGVSPAALRKGQVAFADIDLSNANDNPIRAALRGKDGLQKAADLAGKANNLPSFVTLSGKIEELSSEMAMYAGMREYWERAWQPGKGFDRMDSDLARALDAVQPGLSGRVQRAITRGRNKAQVEKEIFQDFGRKSLHNHLNADEKALLGAVPGLFDDIEDGLKTAETPEQVREVFRAARAKAAAEASRKVAENMRANAEKAAAKAKIEGVHGALDVFDQVAGTRYDFWVQHFIKMDEVAERARMAPDQETAHLIWDNAFRESARAWNDFTNQEGAKFLGVVRGMGADADEVLAVETYLTEIHDLWGTFYAERRKMLADHFLIDFKNAYGKDWKMVRDERWKVLQDKLAEMYAERVELEADVQHQIDVTFAEQFERQFAGGRDAALAWRAGVAQVRRDMTDAMTYFRTGKGNIDPAVKRTIDRMKANHPGAGLPWDDFIAEVYRPLIRRYTDAQNGGARGMYMDPGGTGPRPGGPDAPADTAPTQPEPTAPRPAETQAQPDAVAQPEPAMPQTAPATQAPAAGPIVTPPPTTAPAQPAGRAGEIIAIAQEYGVHTATRAGRPNNRYLLAIMAKYGGVKAKYLDDLDPVQVRSALEKWQEAHAADNVRDMINDRAAEVEDGIGYVESLADQIAQPDAPATTPASMVMPEVGRERFAMNAAGQVGSEQADQVLAVTDAIAGYWAKINGKTRDDWYHTFGLSRVDQDSLGFSQELLQLPPKEATAIRIQRAEKEMQTVFGEDWRLRQNMNLEEARIHGTLNVRQWNAVYEYREARRYMQFLERYGDFDAKSMRDYLADQSNSHYLYQLSRAARVMENPHFRRWFEGSQVVDEDGLPLSLFHGTDAKFEVFETNRAGTVQYSDWGEGIYLTPRRNTAEYYAKEALAKHDAEYNAAYQRYLDVTPKDMLEGRIPTSDESLEALRQFRESGGRARSKTSEVYELYANVKNPYIQQYTNMPDPYLAGRAKAEGYDGIFVLDTDGEIDEVIVFEPTQVKSTINRGTFDPNDPNILYQVTPDQARELNVKVEMPDNPEFIRAIESTPGARITEEGLFIELARTQKAEQAGEESVRTGVFYLAASDNKLKYYRSKNNLYGGPDKYVGETLIRRPYVTKGATGGKVPERAYDEIKGKGAYDAVRNDALDASRLYSYVRGKEGKSSREILVENVQAFLEKYIPEDASRYNAQYIVDNSYGGNLLPYALQERVVAHELRKQGYDSIIGYKNTVTEVFDLRETTYPARGMESEIHPAYLSQGVKGSTTWLDNGQAVIRAYQSADVSTLVHEVAHVWLPQMPAEDIAVVTKWLKDEYNLDLADGWQYGARDNVQAKEYFARGFERYLAEGKAPTPALQKVFESFKQWMLEIYKKISGSDIDIRLNNDIRSLFDKWMGAEEQQALFQRGRRQDPQQPGLFDSPAGEQPRQAPDAPAPRPAQAPEPQPRSEIDPAQFWTPAPDSSAPAPRDYGTHADRIQKALEERKIGAEIYNDDGVIEIYRAGSDDSIGMIYEGRLIRRSTDPKDADLLDQVKQAADETIMQRKQPAAPAQAPAAAGDQEIWKIPQGDYTRRNPRIDELDAEVKRLQDEERGIIWKSDGIQAVRVDVAKLPKAARAKYNEIRAELESIYAERKPLYAEYEQRFIDHENAVIAAIESGKPVPAEVLADYGYLGKSMDFAYLKEKYETAQMRAGGQAQPAAPYEIRQGTVGPAKGKYAGFQDGKMLDIWHDTREAAAAAAEKTIADQAAATARQTARNAEIETIFQNGTISEDAAGVIIGSRPMTVEQAAARLRLLLEKTNERGALKSITDHLKASMKGGRISSDGKTVYEPIEILRAYQKYPEVVSKRTAAPAASQAPAAEPERPNAWKPKARQQGFFESGEDTPLFSGTPQTARDETFAPAATGGQDALFNTREQLRTIEGKQVQGDQAAGPLFDQAAKPAPAQRALVQAKDYDPSPADYKTYITEIGTAIRKKQPFDVYAEDGKLKVYHGVTGSELGFIDLNTGRKVPVKSAYERHIDIADELARQTIRAKKAQAALDAEMQFPNRNPAQIEALKRFIETGEETRADAGAIVTDPAEVQKIKNSIAQGELLLKSGRKENGKKFSPDELESIRRSVAKNKAKLGIEDAQQAPGDSLFQRAPRQRGMFESGEDLPLFSGTPMRAEEQVFRPEAPRPAPMPDRSETIRFMDNDIPVIAQEITEIGSTQYRISVVSMPEHNGRQFSYMVEKRAGDQWQHTAAPIKAKQIGADLVARQEQPALFQGTRETTAAGADPNNTYDFRFKVVDLKDLITSHTDKLDENPDFPQELQPRQRERFAGREQVDRIARELNADALLTDTKTLDRGPMIIGADNIVESGNGRTIALRRAAQQYPERYQAYKEALRSRLSEYGMTEADIEGIEQPVLVRERISDVDRAKFAAEANQAGIMRMSDYEQSLQDANKVTDSMLGALEIGESQSIEEALQTTKNMGLVHEFMNAMPENDRPAMQDAGGKISQAGIRRIKDALFARVYSTEHGLRLLQMFSESVDPVIANVKNAMYGALGLTAKADGLMKSGARDPQLSITEDITRAADVYSRLKQQGESVDAYIAQNALFENELTPLQMRLLEFFNKNGRRQKNIRELLKAYAQEIIDQPPPQDSLFAMEPVTKGDIFDAAIKKITLESDDAPPAGWAAAEKQNRTTAADQAAAGEINAGEGEALPPADLAAEQAYIAPTPAGRNGLDEPDRPATTQPAGEPAQRQRRPRRPKQPAPEAVRSPLGTADGLFDPPVDEAAFEGWMKEISPLLDRAERQVLDDPGGTLEGVPAEAMRGLRSYIGKVQNQMADTKMAAMRYGTARRNFSLLDYNKRRGVDNLAGVVFPYQFWYGRSMINWGLRAVTKPQILANYYRLQNMTGGEMEREGFPTRLKGKVAINAPWLDDWMGEGIFMNPMKQIFPLAQLTRPFEALNEQRTQVDRRTESIIYQMIGDEQISEEEARQALESRRGEIYDRAKAQAMNEVDAEVTGPLDFAFTVSGPSLPLSIAMNYANLNIPGVYKGSRDRISQLPVTKMIQQATGALGIGGPRGVNIEAGIRKAAGLPEMDRYEDYRVDRMLANMTAEGLITADQATRAMINRQGAEFEAAQRRVTKMGLWQYLGAPLSVDFFPEGEQTQRQLKHEYDRAIEAWKESGDTKALSKFFDRYPEYQARMASFQEPEERLKRFVIAEVWNKWNELPAVHKEQVQEQLGDVFTDGFINKETRSYDAISLETLSTWARILKAELPEKAPETPAIPLRLAEKEIADQVEAYNKEKKAKFPNIGKVTGIYYSLPDDQKPAFERQFPAVQQYNQWRTAYLADHPDVIPWVTSEDNALADAPAAVQARVYKYRAERDQKYPGIFQTQEQYFKIPEDDIVAQRVFKAEHPELQEYWDWRKEFAAAMTQASPYIMSEDSLANAILGRKTPSTTSYDGITRAQAEKTIQGFSQELVRVWFAHIYTDRALGAGSMKELGRIWEEQGKPLGSLAAWIKAMKKASK